MKGPASPAIVWRCRVLGLVLLSSAATRGQEAAPTSSTEAVDVPFLRQSSEHGYFLKSGTVQNPSTLQNLVQDSYGLNVSVKTYGAWHVAYSACQSVKEKTKSQEVGALSATGETSNIECEALNRQLEILEPSSLEIAQCRDAMNSILSTLGSGAKELEWRDSQNPESSTRYPSDSSGKQPELKKGVLVYSDGLQTVKENVYQYTLNVALTAESINRQMAPIKQQAEALSCPAMASSVSTSSVATNEVSQSSPSGESETDSKRTALTRMESSSSAHNADVFANASSVSAPEASEKTAEAAKAKPLAQSGSTSPSTTHSPPMTAQSASNSSMASAAPSAKSAPSLAGTGNRAPAGEDRAPSAETSAPGKSSSVNAPIESVTPRTPSYGSGSASKGTAGAPSELPPAAPAPPVNARSYSPLPTSGTGSTAGISSPPPAPSLSGPLWAYPSVPVASNPSAGNIQTPTVARPAKSLPAKESSSFPESAPSSPTYVSAPTLAAIPAEVPAVASTSHPVNRPQTEAKAEASVIPLETKKSAPLPANPREATGPVSLIDSIEKAVKNYFSPKSPSVVADSGTSENLEISSMVNSESADTAPAPKVANSPLPLRRAAASTDASPETADRSTKVSVEGAHEISQASHPAISSSSSSSPAAQRMLGELRSLVLPLAASTSSSSSSPAAVSKVGVVKPVVRRPAAISPAPSMTYGGFGAACDGNKQWRNGECREP